MTSTAELLLATQLEQAGIPFEREVKFHPERKWRADFTILPILVANLLVEIDGGAFIGGRHSRGKGFEGEAIPRGHPRLPRHPRHAGPSQRRTGIVLDQGGPWAGGEFVRRLLDAPVPRIALENPISVISSRIRKPDQIIQPWMFGHPETKATCLWLKNLPLLEPTNIVDGRAPRVHHEPPGPNRWKNRSRTLQGIADAMADQWGSLAVELAA